MGKALLQFYGLAMFADHGSLGLSISLDESELEFVLGKELMSLLIAKVLLKHCVMIPRVIVVSSD